MNHAAPGPSVESFAQLCALLDGGFAARDGVLAAAGLDEAGWQALRAAWLPRLASSDAPALAQQFGRAYAHARRHPGFLALPVLIAEEDPETDAPAPTPEDDDTEGTVERAFPLAGPALPFRVPGLLLPPAPRRYAGELPLLVPASDPSAATLDVPCAPLPSGAALPFTSPPPNGRRLRLLRFDTQTGQPLATPVWIDDPTPNR